ncbi:transcriptional regulator MraZ [Alicyclobacillaceae bacterium I2511]|nr:transcriptional regulator MraZ [Alicyclobacillaceae bacterium I2511]
MFMGEFQHTLDEKGRMIMPVKFRDGLGGSFIMTRGLDHCVFVYSRGEWDSLAAKLKALPMTRADARSFVRFFFSGAAECELDKQGRVLVPTTLREYGQLQRDVIVLGVSNRIEIWDEKEWQQYASGAANSFAAIAEKLVDLEF